MPQPNHSIPNNLKMLKKISERIESQAISAKAEVKGEK